MINRVLNSKTKTVGSAAFVLAFFSIVSGLLGLLRDRLIASRFGAGIETDIYFSAFRIPDFVYGILIAGGITVVFLPLFSEYLKDEKQWSEQASFFVNNIINCLFVVLVVVCFILVLFAPFLIKLIVPGFSLEQKKVAVDITRIMLLSPIFLGISSIFSGILQYFDKFLAYSLAPVMYNLGIILGIIFFVPCFGVYGLAFGVILGTIFHVLIQLPAVFNSGFKYSISLNFKHLDLRQVFYLMVPRIIGAVASNLNLIIITAIASALTIGSISIFSFANNLQSFPVTIIGVSFAISSFPLFSKLLAVGNIQGFKRAFSFSFLRVLFFIIPLSALLFLMRAQIIRLILGAGQFGWTETRLTAATLGIFCFGIIANSLIPLIVRAFYSLKDTKTPVLIGASSVVINILTSFLFVFLLKENTIFKDFASNILRLQNMQGTEVLGLAISFSLVALLQGALLFIFLLRKIGDLQLKEIISSFLRISMSSILMSASVLISLKIISFLVNTETFFGLLLQTAISGFLGVLIYILFSYILKVKEMKDFYGTRSRQN